MNLTIALKIFGFSIAEPLILLVVGATLILSATLARRCLRRQRVLEAAKQIHQTLSGEPTAK
jgi:hypothetical protein